MSAIKSTGLATHLAVTGSLKAALDGAFIYIYDGVVPATADEAISNTLLLKISVGGDGVTGLTFDGAATGGVLSKTSSETWTGTAVAAGTATFFRMSIAAPTGASTTEKRLQGTVGTSALNDIVFSSATLAVSDTRTLNVFQIY